MCKGNVEFLKKLCTGYETWMPHGNLLHMTLDISCVFQKQNIRTQVNKLLIVIIATLFKF